MWNVVHNHRRIFKSFLFHFYSFIKITLPQINTSKIDFFLAILNGLINHFTEKMYSFCFDLIAKTKKLISVLYLY